MNELTLLKYHSTNNDVKDDACNGDDVRTAAVKDEVGDDSS